MQTPVSAFSNLRREPTKPDLSPACQQILDIIQRQPGRQMRDLVIATGYSESKVNGHLITLMHRGLIYDSWREDRRCNGYGLRIWLPARGDA